MKRIVTALVLIPLVLLLVFKAPLWAIALVCCLVALLAEHEYLHIVRQYGVEPFEWLTYGLTIALFIAALFPFINSARVLVPSINGNIFWLVIVFSASPFLFLLAAMRRPNSRESLPAATYSLFGLPYIALSLAALVWIRLHGDGVFWLLVLFAAVWAGDAVAMYIGKAFGKHKLAPRISPNKTWEGSLGSLAGSLIACFVVLQFREQIVLSSRLLFHVVDISIAPPKIMAFVPLVIILNIAGQVGDLMESIIKRGADVKDSGTLLPGHGGILDRIDALLFAAPVLWYYLAIVRNGIIPSY